MRLKKLVFYLRRRTTAIKTPMIPINKLILGKNNLSRKPAFLLTSLTNESIGSYILDIMTFLSMTLSIRECKESAINSIVRWKYSP